MSTNDPFEITRQRFDLPPDVIYLDGNSLGALPKGVAERVGQAITREWGAELIGAWNTSGWVDMPRRVGDRVGRLIGAPAGTVVMGDTLSIKVYQALASALELRPDRRVVLSDSGNFPTDLYMAQGLIASLDRGHELRVLEPEAVEAAIDESVAVLMLTEVDYRTGRLHDMKRLTEKAHAAGALVIWDLAHSAGAIPVDVSGAEADFAVGCSYKYLNGGPGAPAFIYVAPHLGETVRPALSGWFGHDAPFAFEPTYRPADGAERMRVGTPPVLALAALDAALDAWEGVDMAALRRRSMELGELFIARVEAGCPELELASPRDPARRGSQVSFRFADGYAVMQALIAEKVIGDFRAPDIMRFGFTPLYLSEGGVERGAAILVDVMRSRRWDQPRFRQRSRVT
ncbi:kynureninase [Aureimonas sp. ME7]|uniref:kynureninase n=1 Tax=Aureimonas sp. ME7 TaxID=2744252 RepID=UPI0015F429EB|nr:kynureninase [Aureimonas sp. ME7]